MGIQLSIIIPTLNEAERVVSCLASVTQAAPEAEIIVVDGGSRDGTPELARQWPGVRVIENQLPLRARQCNIGTLAATGDILLFLHADTTLTAPGIAEMSTALQRPSVVGGSFRFAISDATGQYRFTEWAANFRSRWMRLPFGDQGIFCRRSVFKRAGGFSEIPLMDDIDFIRRLRHHGRYIILKTAAFTSARRIMRYGVVKSGVKNWGLLTAYRLGVSPQRLAQWYAKGV